MNRLNDDYIPELPEERRDRDARIRITSKLPSLEERIKIPLAEAGFTTGHHSIAEGPRDGFHILKERPSRRFLWIFYVPSDPFYVAHARFVDSSILLNVYGENHLDELLPVLQSAAKEIGIFDVRMNLADRKPHLLSYDDDEEGEDGYYLAPC